MGYCLGVIGGMGPEASSVFYNEVIAHTRAETDQEHIDMIILSHASMPDRTTAILTGDHSRVLEAMEKDVKLLNAAGVDCIAITCNTAHYFYDSIQNMSSVEVINMVRETVREAVKRYGGGAAAEPAEVYKKISPEAPGSERPGSLKIGIMATDGTVRTGVYARECERQGCAALAPGETAQKAVMSIIYDEIKSGKTPDPKKFSLAYDDLKSRGCDCVLLACTELSVYAKHFPVPADCIDAMDILVRESIIRSGAEYKL